MGGVLQKYARFLLGESGLYVERKFDHINGEGDFYRMRERGKIEGIWLILHLPRLEEKVMQWLPGTLSDVGYNKIGERDNEFVE